jgi:hypothetical protein
MGFEALGKHILEKLFITLRKRRQIVIQSGNRIKRMHGKN